jgi:hypothetical protein
LGWRRGARREVIVFTVAAISWILLQYKGDVFVNIANLAAAGLSFALSGGFTGSQEEAFAAITSTPDLITDSNRAAFLFLLWLAAFVTAYILTNLMVADKNSPRNGWAALAGMGNGLFFATAFLPSLYAIFAPEGTTLQVDSFSLGALITSTLDLLWDGIKGLWSLIASLGSLALLALLTILLVIAAKSISSGAKAKS